MVGGAIQSHVTVAPDRRLQKTIHEVTDLLTPIDLNGSIITCVGTLEQALSITYTQTCAHTSAHSPMQTYICALQ